MEESKLLEKNSFKENLQTIRQVLKMIYSWDKSYFWLVFLEVVLSTVWKYGAMILSAYIIDALTAGNDFSKILNIAVLGTVLLSLGQSVSNILDGKINLKDVLMAEQYQALQQEKLMDMDFSLIDSPRLKEIRERIRLDGNWGAGIFSMFWDVKRVMQQAVDLIGAVIIAVPMLHYLWGNSKMYSLGVWLALVVVLILGVKYIKIFADREAYVRFHIPTREEKKFLWNYVWDFALQTGFNYKQGKDIRIYNGEKLIRFYTYDKLQSKEFKNYYIRQSAMGVAERGGMSAAVEGIMLIGAYIMAVLAALDSGIQAGTAMLLAGCLSEVLLISSRLFFTYNDISLTAKKQTGIMELLAFNDEMYKGSLPMEKRSDNQYQIEFRDVSFRYPGSDQYALRHFSFQLNIGEKLAIVGRNGSGKTTMIKLLCRLYDPEEGEILLNGVDIKKFRHDEYSKLFSVVFQDYVLFSLMLAENVAASKNYDRDKVIKCLENAGLGERLRELEGDGIEVYLYKDYTDEGIEISGGEAQKIAIARGIYKNAPFVLLDEPTASLDPIAESEIYTNFDKIAADKTAVYISHRLSSCKFCDKIAVFREGQLVQYGSHDELLKDTQGEYFKMWDRQAQYYT